MRFVSFMKDGQAKIGVRTDAGLVDLSKVDKKLPTDLKELIGQGKSALQLLNVTPRPGDDLITALKSIKAIDSVYVLDLGEQAT